MSRFVFKMPDLGEGTVSAEVVEWKVKVTVVFVVLGGGPESITVCGGVASTWNSRRPAADTLPAASVPRTRKTCWPSSTLVYAMPVEEQLP